MSEGAVCQIEWTYAEARGQIRDMDILAFKGRGFVSRMISIFSGGAFTHVGLALWVHDRLMILESREFRGARIVFAAREIERCDVYWFTLREPTLFPPEPGWAMENAGKGYNYLGILRYTYRVLPTFARWLLPRTQADSIEYGNRFCSEFASAAYRKEGIDLRPDLLDAATSPAELCASPLLRCVGRLSA